MSKNRKKINEDFYNSVIFSQRFVSNSRSKNSGSIVCCWFYRLKNNEIDIQCHSLNSILFLRCLNVDIHDHQFVVQLSKFSPIEVNKWEQIIRWNRSNMLIKSVRWRRKHNNRHLHTFAPKIHSSTGIWHVICIRATLVRKLQLNAIHRPSNPMIHIYCKLINELRSKCWLTILLFSYTTFHTIYRLDCVNPSGPAYDRHEASFISHVHFPTFMRR